MKGPGLKNFVASKANAAPSPLRAPEEEAALQPPPERQGAGRPKVKSMAEPLVPINFKAPKSFRADLKRLAAEHETTVTKIIEQGIELYRAKFGSKPSP